MKTPLNEKNLLDAIIEKFGENLKMERKKFNRFAKKLEKANEQTESKTNCTGEEKFYIINRVSYAYIRECRKLEDGSIIATSRVEKVEII